MRLSRKRAVLVGLFSARIPGPHGEIDAMAQRVEEAAGEVGAQIVQRQGLSRSRRPGGAARTHGPLSNTTVIVVCPVFDVVVLSGAGGSALR